MRLGAVGRHWRATCLRPATGRPPSSCACTMTSRPCVASGRCGADSASRPVGTCNGLWWTTVPPTAQPTGFRTASNRRVTELTVVHHAEAAARQEGSAGRGHRRRPARPARPHRRRLPPGRTGPIPWRPALAGPTPRPTSCSASAFQTAARPGPNSTPSASPGNTALCPPRARPTWGSAGTWPTGNPTGCASAAFDHHLDLASGDDDLFVQDAAAQGSRVGRWWPRGPAPPAHAARHFLLGRLPAQDAAPDHRSALSPPGEVDPRHRRPAGPARGRHGHGRSRRPCPHRGWIPLVAAGPCIDGALRYLVLVCQGPRPSRFHRPPRFRARSIAVGTARSGHPVQPSPHRRHGRSGHRQTGRDRPPLRQGQVRLWPDPPGIGFHDRGLRRTDGAVPGAHLLHAPQDGPRRRRCRGPDDRDLRQGLPSAQAVQPAIRLLHLVVQDCLQWGH